jgi:hypothetical protein
MLGVLCSLYAAGKSMPNDRSELYTRCAEMLFNEWDAGRRIQIQISDPVAAELAVRELALEIFESGREEIPESRLIQLLTRFYELRKGQDFVNAGRMARETLKHWRGRKWLLITAGQERGEELFRFAHRTFLEFFAAEQTAFLVSGSGKKLAKRLLPYMEVRASIPFVLLTLQISSRSNRGVAKAFVKRTIKYVDAAEERNPRVSFNLLLCLVDGLGVLDVENVADRQPVVKRVLNFVAVHLPPADDRPTQQYTGAYCYDDVWGGDGVSELREVSDRGDVTVGSLSLLVGGMESVRADERAVLLQWLREILVDPAGLGWSLQAWLRVLLFLYFAPDFEDWTRTDTSWSSAVKDLAESLLDELSTVPIRVEDLDEPEFWLGVLLLKEQLSDDPRLLEWIGVEGLFVSGTQYPIVRFDSRGAGRPGTIAHDYVERLLGHAHFDAGPLKDAIWAGPTAQRFGWVPNLDYFGSRRLDVPISSNSTCTGLQTPESRYCLAYLTLALTHHGDSECVEVVAAGLAAQDGEMAATMRALLALELDPDSTERSSTLTKKLGLTTEMSSRLYELRLNRGKGTRAAIVGEVD